LDKKINKTEVIWNYFSVSKDLTGNRKLSLKSRGNAKMTLGKGKRKL